MRSQPRLSSFTCLAYEINAAIDEGYSDKVSFNDIYGGLERGRLLEDPTDRIPGVFDFGLFLTDQERYLELMEALADASAILRGRESRKVGVERSGLTLLMAIILEAIQQQNSIATPRAAASPNETTSIHRFGEDGLLPPLARMPLYELLLGELN